MLRRIVRHAEYVSFVDAGKSCRIPHFFIPLLFTDEDSFAYGITINAGNGVAVRRNRLKRRIKAWFYENSATLPSGVKINLIARKGACELSWAELCSELTLLISTLKNRDHST